MRRIFCSWNAELKPERAILIETDITLDLGSLASDESMKALPHRYGLLRRFLKKVRVTRLSKFRTSTAEVGSMNNCLCLLCLTVKR